MKKRLLCCLLAAFILTGSVLMLSPRSRAADDMTTSDQLIDVLKKMEGFAPRAFWDHAQWTVGYGTRCPNDMLSTYDAATGRDITEEEAEELLQTMLLDFEKEVNGLIDDYGLSLTQYEFDALVSFTYNCGGLWTYNESSALNRAVRAGLTGTDLIYTLCLYSMVDTDYALIQRRLSEAYLYLEGQYEAYNVSSDGTYPYSYRYVYLDGNGGEVLYDIHGYTADDAKAPKTTFTRIPTGMDANGNPFIYSFAGWYTAPVGGSKVEKLDGNLPVGTVLYAQWADPAGQIVPLPKGLPVNNVETVVFARANVRTGPGTFYAKTGQLQSGDTITVTQVYREGDLLWGKFDGGWTCLNYTYYDGPTPAEEPDITGVTLVTPPTSTCVQGHYPSDLQGSVLQISYADGTIGARTLDTDMITACNTEKLGETTVTASYSGFTVTFPMTVEKATVTFRNADGTVLSQAQYAKGETVQIPANPSQEGNFQFSGWTPQVIPCNGNRVYTAVYTLDGPPAPPETAGPDPSQPEATDPPVTDPEPTDPDPTDPVPPAVPQWPRTAIITGKAVNLRTGPGTNYDRVDYQLNTGSLVVIYEVAFDGTQYNWGRLENGHWVCMDYVKLLSIESATLPGDTNGDSIVNKDDAIYLLRHVVFPDKYPMSIDADINADNEVNKDDAIYLLRHVVFPDKYPLIYG